MPLSIYLHVDWQERVPWWQRVRLLDVRIHSLIALSVRKSPWRHKVIFTFFKVPLFDRMFQPILEFFVLFILKWAHYFIVRFRIIFYHFHNNFWIQIRVNIAYRQPWVHRYLLVPLKRLVWKRQIYLWFHIRPIRGVPRQNIHSLIVPITVNLVVQGRVDTDSQKWGVICDTGGF